jgi:hypothetical protein
MMRVLNRLKNATQGKSRFWRVAQWYEHSAQCARCGEKGKDK